MKRQAILPLSAIWGALASLTCGGDATAPPAPERPVATSVVVVSGEGQSALPNMWLPDPVVVQVLDQNGLAFPAASVTFRPSGDDEIEQDRPASGFDGKVTIRWRLGGSVGPHVTEALVGGIAGSIRISAEGAQMDPVDLARVEGAPQGSYGLLASGTTPFGNVVDFQGSSSQAESVVGDFRNPAESARNEIVFFAPNVPPRLFMNPWTDGADIVDTAFGEPLVVPLTVWIMETPFESTVDRVLRDIDRTQSIYTDESLGIVFDVEIVDATATEGIQPLMQFDCGKAAETERTVGHRDDRLNLYYLSVVDGGAGRGVTCPVGGNFVAMANRALEDLLSHEIGHTLGLFHVDAWENFGRTNVMHSASSSRRYLTEGQVFRAHWGSRSVLNGTLGLHPAELLRNCLGQFDESACPSINTRLFPDGGIVASAMATEPAAPLSRLEQALLRRCNSGDGPDSELGYDPAELVAAFRRDSSSSLAIREEALRLLVLNDDGRAREMLDQAMLEDPEGFSGVVRWGRERLSRQ